MAGALRHCALGSTNKIELHSFTSSISDGKKTRKLSVIVSPLLRLIMALPRPPVALANVSYPSSQMMTNLTHVPLLLTQVVTNSRQTQGKARCRELGLTRLVTGS